tara:strand:+ start:970 stop:1452 length:483 start_codon:yes stop_codon:yes gene_type:complete
MERKRIPMNVPVQKLEVPEIPGYRLYWFRGEPSRLGRAEQAGYEYVDRGEIELNSTGLADSAADGNSDMGSRVSIAAGDMVGEDRQPLRLVLMKIREEWALENDGILEDRNESIAAALRGGQIGSEKDRPDDRDARYVGSQTKIPELFRRKPRALSNPIR